MTTAMVLIEHNNQTLKASSLIAITAAIEVAEEVIAVVAGYQCASIVDSLKKVRGIKKIVIADHACYEFPLAESLGPLLTHLVEQYHCTHLLAAATTFGKNILPRVAAMLNVAQISEVVAVVNPQTYQRPIYAGNAIATVVTNDPIHVITVRMTAFSPAQSNNVESVPVDTVHFIVENNQSKFISKELSKTGRPELTSAEVIISGGRGLGDKATFDRLTSIADRMQAAIGASRAAVDAGLAPNDFQVGQTGQIVAPKLYFAVGISGAIQHLAGMKESQVIVAINKDPDAPIFQIADYALVADIKEVLTDWEKYLEEQGK